MMIFRFSFLLVCISVAITSCKEKPLTDKDIDVLKHRIIQCIASDLKQDSSLCEYKPDSKDHRLGFYSVELEQYPLNKALHELATLYSKGKFKGEDIFGILMLYPRVGFDPQVGYKFAFILYSKSEDKAFFSTYNYGNNLFTTVEKSKQDIEDIVLSYSQVENGCGDGYLIYYYSSFDLQSQGCICAHDFEDK
jgi:hypothetical protein